jgi:DNA polymerase III subunit beta
MRVTVERAALLKALAHVQSVVERRNTIPILSNVLIQAEAGGPVKLMATDLDLAVVETAIAQVEQAGGTTVAAHTLFDIVRKMPEGAQISLAASDKSLTITAGRSRFQLATLPREDFPVLSDGDLPFGFVIPSATLRQIIDKTRFAISTEETRYCRASSRAARGRHRWPPPGPGGIAPTRRGGVHAGHHFAAQSGGRAAQAAG